MGSARMAHGKDADKVTRTLAERRTDKPNPLYNAQRTIDIASPRLWLLEGAPIADVITMLQVRRRFEIPSAFVPPQSKKSAGTKTEKTAPIKVAVKLAAKSTPKTDKPAQATAKKATAKRSKA
jgi:hypothetical protein